MTDPSSFLPLQEPTFFILLSLAPGNKHGYAILKDVEDLSRGKIRLSTGTLYGALSRLLDQGLVERVDEEPGEGQSANRGRPRKAYRLSILGRDVLGVETQRMQSLVAAARLRLGQEN